MNRRLSMLCLLVVVGAVVLATGAWAARVPLQVQFEGWDVMTGWDELPDITVSVWSTQVGPSTLDIDRVAFIFTVNAFDGTISDGQAAYVTTGGDVLYGRIPSGTSYPTTDPPDGIHFGATWQLDVVGGTGRFAGARGSATVTSQQTVVTWPISETVEIATDGVLNLSSRTEKTEPVEFDMAHMGARVSEPEAFPYFYEKVSITGGLSDYWGSYTSTRVGLLNLGVWPPWEWGFLTVRDADGNICYSYFEGAAVPLNPDMTDWGVDLHWWITGGTERFRNATGYLEGTGFAWGNGQESYSFAGMLSPREHEDE